MGAIYSLETGGYVDEFCSVADFMVDSDPDLVKIRVVKQQATRRHVS
jgi:hypothetical protein